MDTNIADVSASEMVVAAKIAQRVVDVSPDQIVVIGTDYRFRRVNDAFLKAWNGMRYQVVGKHVADVVGESLFDSLIRVDCDRCLRGEEVFRDAWIDFPQLGRTFQSISYTPLRSELGLVCGIIAIFRDKTTYKEAEDDLGRARDEAVLADRAKTEFLANMSHEFRTPLNAILGFAETIRQETFGRLENEKYAEYIENIHAAGERLLELINDIMDISVVEKGDLTLMEEPVDPAEVVTSVSRLFETRSRQHGIRLETEIEAGLPMVLADRSRLKQILVNLLSNGVKFTPAGGQVKVAARLDDDGGLILSVADTGIGMDEGAIERVQVPFWHEESQTARQRDGVGLSLPLSKSLVEAHDGTLEIESTPNVGTRVTICLPPSRILPSIADTGTEPGPTA